MRRLSVCLLMLAAVLVLPQVAHARASAEKLEAIEKHRATTWRWQRLMGVAITPSHYSERRASTRYLDWLEEVWQRRARRARSRAARPPHVGAWRCIHRHERNPDQGWATQTGNGYYGGLQMNLAFQRRHGGFLLRLKGTADKWTPLEQMWVAERALRAGRGFYPWPNTARACGLL